MKKLFSRFTALEIVMGFLVTGLLLGLIFVSYSIYLYQAVMESKESGIDAAKRLAVEKSSIAEIEEVSRYHGSELFFAVQGTNAEGEELIVFIPGEETGTKEVNPFLLEELIPREQILSTWKQECGECRLVNYNWGLESSIPLLEVTYISQNNRYVLEYYNLTNGDTYQRLPLKRSLY